MNRRPAITSELIGILAVGMALAGLVYTGQARTDASLAALNARLTALESRVSALEQGQAVLLERTAPL